MQWVAMRQGLQVDVNAHAVLCWKCDGTSDVFSGSQGFGIKALVFFANVFIRSCISALRRRRERTDTL